MPHPSDDAQRDDPFREYSEEAGYAGDLHGTSQYGDYRRLQSDGGHLCTLCKVNWVRTKEARYCSECKNSTVARNVRRFMRRWREWKRITTLISAFWVLSAD